MRSPVPFGIQSSTLPRVYQTTAKDAARQAVGRDAMAHRDLGYHLFGGYVVRGMRGFALSQAKAQQLPENTPLPDFAFEWQRRDMEQCARLYTSGAPGHINATGMGMGKTISTIAECLCIRDGVFERPTLFAPCRDGSTLKNRHFDMLRDEIYRIVEQCKRQQRKPPFANTAAWIDRAWFYLCTNQFDAPEIQALDYGNLLWTHIDMTKMWRDRHSRMYAHPQDILPVGMTYSGDIVDCSHLLIMGRAPVLVVCGPTFASEWFEELEKLTPGSVKVLNLACDYSGTFKNARSRYSQTGNGNLLLDIANNDYDFIFTTYGYLGGAYSNAYTNKNKNGAQHAAHATRGANVAEIGTRDFLRANRIHANRCALMSVVFSAIVVDEAHKICNSATIRHSGVRFAKSFFKIFITGTPIQNNIGDLRALLLALNFEHCLLYETVFHQACQARYQSQYEQMRQQYIEERANVLLNAPGGMDAELACIHDRTQRLKYAKERAEEEISPAVCAQIAQCSRAELQAQIAKADESDDPWRLRQLFVAIMSLKELHSGELVSMYELKPESEGIDVHTNTLPRFVDDDDRSIDPIFKVVRYMFHWEQTETLQEYMKEYHCKRLALKRAVNDNFPKNWVQEDINAVQDMLAVTHTDVQRPFIYKHEIEVYASVCKNTIALIHATSDDSSDEMCTDTLRNMQAALHVSLLRMQQVCMNPALPFLPSGENSVDHVETVRAIIIDRIESDGAQKDNSIGWRAATDAVWYAGDTYKNVPESLDDAQRMFQKHAANMSASLYRTDTALNAGAAADEALAVDLDTLAIQKRILVPYRMFSTVLHKNESTVLPSTKETMLYQLFTNRLPEMLNGDPTRLVTKGTKIIVFDTYPIIQTLHERAAYTAFGPNSSVCISGRVPQKRRDELRMQFKTDPKVRVLFLTLETGAHALNIPEAHIVVFTTPWWNPAKPLQAEYRARRPSRMHPVHVYNFCITDTIETYVIQCQNEKRELAKIMLAYDDPFTGILQTNQRLRALQRYDAHTMTQVANNIVKCNNRVNYQYARLFLDRIREEIQRVKHVVCASAEQHDLCDDSRGQRPSSQEKTDALKQASQFRSAFDAFVHSMQSVYSAGESGDEARTRSKKTQLCEPIESHPLNSEMLVVENDELRDSQEMQIDESVGIDASIVDMCIEEQCDAPVIDPDMHVMLCEDDTQHKPTRKHRRRRHGFI